MSTEYRVTLTAQSDLQGSSVSIHDQVWNVAQYGLGHIGKIVSVLVEDSARKQASWDRWVDAIGDSPASSVEWGTWVDTFGNTRTYISATIAPVDVPESEWAGLGER